jgi:hypothetical protein
MVKKLVWPLYSGYATVTTTTICTNIAVDTVVTNTTYCYYCSLLSPSSTLLNMIKKDPWSESASELYRPSDHRLSAKNKMGLQKKI